MFGYLAANAAMALFHAVREAVKAAALALKYEACAGWMAARSAAIALATAGIVPGLYHRCGFGVPVGRPSRSWTTMTLRAEFGAAFSIVCMNVS